MYNTHRPTPTTIKRNTSFDGESIETKVARILTNKEPIKDAAPLIYTERKHGVMPELDIRADRWELALDAMDKVAADKLAKRADRQLARETPLEANKDLKGIIGKTESTQGTTDKGTDS